MCRPNLNNRRQLLFSRNLLETIIPLVGRDQWSSILSQKFWVQRATDFSCSSRTSRPSRNDSKVPLSKNPQLVSLRVWTSQNVNIMDKTASNRRLSIATRGRGRVGLSLDWPLSSSNSYSNNFRTSKYSNNKSWDLKGASRVLPNCKVFNTNQRGQLQDRALQALRRAL